MLVFFDSSSDFSSNSFFWTSNIESAELFFNIDGASGVEPGAYSGDEPGDEPGAYPGAYSGDEPGAYSGDEPGAYSGDGGG